ncbi:MAG: hypothetical protein A2086_12980 [Spirochaetes bacterium GWD1_27_9]|nr:MAG: hypothetical protein A2Z98_13485 [Spirochaetes bacterium GWB1_27_13]OHD43575.1 MAG: hypothetical protein A2086_12980 [Spirochaetes bacterium GWD1_27_9]
MMDKNSISAKISFITILVVIIITGITGVLQYYSESKKSKEGLTNSANLTLKRLANNLREPVWNIEETSLKTVVQLEVKGDNVLAIAVYLDTEENFHYGEIKKENNKTTSFKNSEQFNTQLDKYYFKLVGKIEKENQVIGFVSVYYTDKFLRMSLLQITIKNILQTIALSIILVLSLYMTMSNIIIRPIIMLNRVVGRFSDKEFDVRADVMSADEIGNLSENFNNMAVTIQHYSEHLEELVAKRTEELNKANKELLIANEQMKKELQMAQRIQEAMIPKIFPLIEQITLDGMYVPMDALGGDYYDVFKITDKKLGMVIADVCGHGVPAALITTMAKVSFTNNSKNEKDSGDVVRSVNDELFSVIGNMEYLTAFYAILDVEKGTIQYTNAGHNDIFIIKKNGTFVALKQNAPIIGFCKNIEYESSIEQIDIGDRIVLYTDGIPELRDSDAKFYGQERLVNILVENKEITAKEVIDKLFSDINNFKGAAFANDDMTILIADITENSSGIKIDVECSKLDDFHINLGPSNVKEMVNKYYLALEHVNKGDFITAKNFLEELKNKFNQKHENFKVLSLLGYVDYKLKNFNDSIKSWEEALIIYPDNVDIIKNISIVKQSISG